MKVLLIEDDPSIAKIVSIGLRNVHMDVSWAETGLQGLHLAISTGFDLIILDLMLPDKNGDEICRQLRNAKFNTPIIVLTALSDLQTKVKMLNLGADDYMIKPFDFEELHARIKSALRKQKIEVGEVLDFDDLQLDKRSHEVRRRGKKLELREKEIKILEYLMIHPNQVLTREMILDYVWGPHVERFTNVVDVHIHHLREKLDKPYGTHLLKTVNNVGYKISLH